MPKEYPELISLIKSKGHIIGNHGYHHLDGWKTVTRVYLEELFDQRSFHLKFPPSSAIWTDPPYPVPGAV